MSDIDDLLRESVRSVAEALRACAVARSSTALTARRPRWARRGFVAALALALAGALLVGNPTGSRRPSPLERASAAVSDWPPNQILHARQLMVSHFDQPDQLQESGNSRARRTRGTRHRISCRRDGGDRIESANAEGLGQAFDSRTNEVGHPDRVLRLEAHRRRADDARRHRGLVANSHASSLGESEVDGHRVLGFEAFGHARLYVDAETYLPMLDRSFGFGIGDERRGYDHHYSWELLPATARTSGSWTCPCASRCSVATLSGDAWRAAQFALGGLMKTLDVPAAERRASRRSARRAPRARRPATRSRARGATRTRAVAMPSGAFAEEDAQRRLLGVDDLEDRARASRSDRPGLPAGVRLRASRTPS